MHFPQKIAAFVPAACLLLLSACATTVPLYSPEHTIVFYTVTNPDHSEGYAPLLTYFDAVTFDNHIDKKLDRYVNPGFFDGPLSNQPLTWFYGDVRVMTNMLPGRYHVHALADINTIYRLGEKPKKVEGETVFDATDWYFVLPSSTPKFIGDYLFCIKCTKGHGFNFVPDQKGAGEATAITSLLKNAEFLKTYPDFIPMLRQRLDKITRATPPPVAAAVVTPKTDSKPAPVKKTTKKARK